MTVVPEPSAYRAVCAGAFRRRHAQRHRDQLRVAQVVSPVQPRAGSAEDGRFTFWLLFLPRYSPDFSPIEKAFAKLKALLRKAAERTVSGVRQAIQRTLAGIMPTECANFFASAGYDPI